MCLLNICKDVLGQIPKVVGIDIVEMALWAKENTPAPTNQVNNRDGPFELDALVTEKDTKVTVEKGFVTEAEEEDMEALLGTYVLGIGEAEAFSERLKRELLALEAANVHAILETEPLIQEAQSPEMVRNELTLRPFEEDNASEMEDQGSVLAMDVDDDLEPLELFGESFLPPDSTKLVDRDFFNSFPDDFDDSDIN